VSYSDQSGHFFHILLYFLFICFVQKARKTSKITLNHITNDFYQNDENVDWTLYIKEIDENSCDVKFSSNNAYIRFRTK
jgi:hypothetical protein